MRKSTELLTVLILFPIFPESGLFLTVFYIPKHEHAWHTNMDYRTGTPCSSHPVLFMCFARSANSNNKLLKKKSIKTVRDSVYFFISIIALNCIIFKYFYE